MKKLLYNPFLLISLFTCISYSQGRIVTGSVTTLENIAVVNVEVKVLSSKMIVLTDSIGRFRISCLLNDKIKVSAKGFVSQKVKIDDKTKELFINLKFKPSEKNIDVAVGYGHINERDKTHVIKTFKNNKENKFSRFSNIFDLIDAISPSITVRGTSIIIRGSNSLLGGNNAIVVVDGVDTPTSQLGMLSPVDVKSVDILDGGSAAIYGSRGANGVVLITTKRGGD